MRAKDNAGCNARIEVASILISALALFGSIVAIFQTNRAISEAKKANGISAKGLRASHVPWLQVLDIHASYNGNDELRIVFNLKNYSQSPALGVRPSLYFGNIVQPSLEQHFPAIMPQDAQQVICWMKRKPQSGDILELIKSGKMEIPIRIVLTYADIFKTNYAVQVEYVWEKEGFMRKAYRVIDMPL